MYYNLQLTLILHTEQTIEPRKTLNNDVYTSAEMT
jgi:hypothetical protein